MKVSQYSLDELKSKRRKLNVVGRLSLTTVLLSNFIAKTFFIMSLFVGGFPIIVGIAASALSLGCIGVLCVSYAKECKIDKQIYNLTVPQEKRQMFDELAKFYEAENKKHFSKAAAATAKQYRATHVCQDDIFANEDSACEYIFGM
jgi:hypothetical protein